MTNLTDQQSAMIVLLGIGFLASIAGNIANAVSAFRRKPPIDQTLQDYVKRDEFTNHLERSDSIHAELYNLIRTQQTTASEFQSAVMRQLGSIEESTNIIKRKMKL